MKVTRPTKVLILTSTFIPTTGGLQYELKWFLDNLDRYLNERSDIQVHFAYPNKSSEPYARFDNILTCDLQLNNLGKPAVLQMLPRLGKYLQKIEPDVVHCHAVLPDGLWVLLACWLFRVRTNIAITSHGGDIVWLPEISYGMRHAKRSRFLAKKVTGQISAHVLPSRALFEYAVDAGTPEERISFIFNGIPVGDEYDFEQDAAYYPALAHRGIDIAQSAGIDILSLIHGRPAIKNLKSLIEAFALVRRKLGGSRLLLACDERLDRPTRLLAKDRGVSRQVVFIGKVTGPTKHAYLRASDVYCMPSLFENFPVSLLEAMKFETAILANRVGGIPEFVEDGKDGLLVSPTDLSEMASALVRLYRDADLRRRLVASGLQTVKRYSISRVIEDYIALYRRVGYSGR